MLAYDVAGAAEAPVALLLHDSADDRRAWRALAMDMVEDFRTIAPDLRGFGESGRPPNPAAAPEIGDYADDLIALVDGEGVDTFAVIGAGFGAEVALELALGAPERVDLVVLSGALPAADHPSYTEGLRAYQQQLAERARLAGRFGMGRAGVNAATALEGNVPAGLDAPAVRPRGRGRLRRGARGVRGPWRPPDAAGLPFRSRTCRGGGGRPAVAGGEAAGGHAPTGPAAHHRGMRAGGAVRGSAGLRGGAGGLLRGRAGGRSASLTWVPGGEGLLYSVPLPTTHPRGCQRMKRILALLVLLAVAASVVVVMRRSAGVDDFLDEDLD